MRRDMVPKQKSNIQNSSHPSTEILRLTGMSSYGDNLKTLAKANGDWNLTPEQVIASGKANRKIYRIRFINNPVRFSPSEENPNTTYVFINGTIIGILDQENTSRLKSLIASSDIHNVSCVIQGGLYKIVDESCNVEIQQKGIAAVIKITHQPKVSAVPVPTVHQQKNLRKAKGKAKGKEARRKKKSKKPLFKRIWFWILALILVLGSCNKGADNTIPAEITISTTSIAPTETTLAGTSLPVTEPTTVSTTIPTTIPTTATSIAPTTEAYVAPIAEPTTPPTTDPYEIPVTETITTPDTVPLVEEEEEIVWLSRTGSKYHCIPNCGNMKNPIPASLEEALNQGREACSKCY